MGLGESTGRDHLMELRAPEATLKAFKAYEAVRHRLPSAPRQGAAEKAPGLLALADRFDAFVLDGFGVLNVGEAAIPGAVEVVTELQRMGKTVIVLTNAAGYPKRLLMQRYSRLGFSFEPANAVSSREVMLHALAQYPKHKWGAMAATKFGTEELEDHDIAFLGDDPGPYTEVDAFILFGSSEWTMQRQRLIERALQDRPRPILVGNPDIVAPVEGGMSWEPGHFAHNMADASGVEPEFFGKPFKAAFGAVLERIPETIDRNRIAMVGDTLQTDVLGGLAAGIGTILVTDHGFFANADFEAGIELAAISPDYIIPTP